MSIRDHFKETINIREVSLLGKAYPNHRYFKLIDHTQAEESHLVKEIDELSLKGNVQNNETKLQPKMGMCALARYRSPSLY